MEEHTDEHWTWNQYTPHKTQFWKSLTFEDFLISVTILQISLTLKKNQISLLLPWPVGTLKLLKT